MKKSDIKIILLSSFGGMLEFYDFVIFAIFASTIGEIFFPHSSSLLSILYGFSSFAIGYLARPIGGVLFGHLGDTYGRKLVFSSTIFIMGVSTICMGILPGYENIGLSATFLFIILRLLQGMAIGGELAGAITFVSEHIPKSKKLAIGILYGFVNMGILLASFVYYLTSGLTYGWRVAAILGGVAAFISYLIRKSLLETPEYQKCTKVHYPIIKVFRSYILKFIVAFFLMSYLAVIVSLGFLFITSYLKIINFESHRIGNIATLGMLFFTISTVFFAFFTKYLKNQQIWLSVFIIISSVLSCIVFINYQVRTFNIYYYCLFAFSCGPLTIFIPNLLTEIFPTNIRYSGIGVAYNLAFAIFGGLSPLVTTIILATNSNLSILSPSIIIVFCAIFALVSIHFYFWDKAQ
ncbi:MFS transporter [Francisellaceae bacterium CB300]